LIAVLIACCCTAANAHRAYLPEQEELFARALAQQGLTLADVYIDQADMALWGGDKYRPSLLTTFMEDPWKISPYTRTFTDGLLDKQDDLASLVVSAHKRTGHAVRLGLIDDPLEKCRQRAEELGDEALAIALSELTGKKVESYLDDAYESIDPALRGWIAEFLLCVPDVLEYRQQGLVEPIAELDYDIVELRRVVLDYVLHDADEPEEDEDESAQALMIETVLDAIDWDLYNTGATLLVVAAQQLANQLRELDPEVLAVSFDYSVETPIGQVTVVNSGRFRLDPLNTVGEHLLSVSFCEDDSYDAAAQASGIVNPISVSIDLKGNDLYLDYSDATPGNASALFGYAVLIDTEGNDIYMPYSLGQGCGVFGTAVLWDLAGDDYYLGDQLCQGAGAFGTGLLVDNEGDDTYELYCYGQGYGYTLGCGYLIDGEGNDIYIGREDPAERANGGPFGAERFIHFAQGAAYGRRSDFTDGHSWAGGTGVLVDGAGDDEYHCEVYGQGTGYWYAVGILADKGGNDYHHAGWYSLGSSPHFAAGIFQDDGGDDQYYLKHMQSMGNGRDFSIGWFEDAAGNDHYQGGVMTLGVGDINGIVVFCDRGGDYVYLAMEPCLGQSRIESAGSLRDHILTLGLFVDGGGLDRYFMINDHPAVEERQHQIIDDIELIPEFEFGANDSVWMCPAAQNDVPGAYGCGIDARSQNVEE